MLLDLLKGLWCRIVGHDWRRARKGETTGINYCRRCTATRPVHTRKKAVA